MLAKRWQPEAVCTSYALLRSLRLFSVSGAIPLFSAPFLKDDVPKRVEQLTYAPPSVSDLDGRNLLRGNLVRRGSRLLLRTFPILASQAPELEEFFIHGQGTPPSPGQLLHSSTRAGIIAFGYSTARGRLLSLLILAALLAARRGPFPATPIYRSWVPPHT